MLKLLLFKLAKLGLQTAFRGTPVVLCYISGGSAGQKIQKKKKKNRYKAQDKKTSTVCVKECKHTSDTKYNTGVGAPALAYYWPLHKDNSHFLVVENGFIYK